MSQLNSLDVFQRRLSQPGVRLVDTRPSQAFNGWRLQQEARGGHIPGALSLPRDWIEQVPPADLPTFLNDRGLGTTKQLVLYGYQADRQDDWAAILTGLGYSVEVFTPGYEAWAEVESLPLERLANFHKLVYPNWLAALLEGHEPESFPGRGYLLLHVNFGMPQEYAYAHLPQARYLDTNFLESNDTWNRRSPAEIGAALAQAGISRDATVVLYGRDSVPSTDEPWPGRHAGQIAAFRAAAVLNYAGIQDVRVLDGGFDAWVAAGLPTETEIRSISPAADYSTEIPARPDIFVDLPEARELLNDSNGRLVSIRTWDEFTGQVSGYRYIGPQGRIPGAVWGNCGANAYHMQHYRSPINTMRPYYEIEAIWDVAGIRKHNRVAFYCGTGWRASETLFYAQLLGWEQVAIYDGGWYEWSSDPNNPIETGIPGEQLDSVENTSYVESGIPQYSGENALIGTRYSRP
jgi:thiosulfate/3-mercaptopyruvate sulfurtransferase